MALADCESELFRDDSRGKNAMDGFKDHYILKSDARFLQYFFHNGRWNIFTLLFTEFVFTNASNLEFCLFPDHKMSEGSSNRDAEGVHTDFTDSYSRSAGWGTRPR